MAAYGYANAEKMRPSSVGVSPSSFRSIGPATEMFTRSMYAMKYIRHRTNRIRCLIFRADRVIVLAGSCDEGLQQAQTHMGLILKAEGLLGAPR
ncbi:MAG: hypothetical protein AUF76_07775 [Acidobacteria bacterium 13_1_20CM_2_65_9]|nr:MAG: hypothetical protein AUF76_07775 [Acidobacteria bacterium 13_1_20CM_2_65_9]